MLTKNRLLFGVVLVCWMAGPGLAMPITPMPGESKRLARAKDFMADEQWTRAIRELRALLSDAAENGKDEGLYWLAHSLKHSGDTFGALSTIARLERRYASSVWVKPARALRLEIAVQLGRSDVLWLTAAPPPPPAPPTRMSVPAPPSPPPVRRPRQAPAPPAPPDPPRVTIFTTTPPLSIWLPEKYEPDFDLRVQALGYLIRTDAEKAIPLLKDIVLESENPNTANRAVFVLAQCDLPEARETVVEVARTGPPTVRVAAVRELARFGGPEIPKMLLERVYPTADLPVKRQVVKSLAERAERSALLNIVRVEADRDLRTRAVVSLGQAGGVGELRVLYERAGGLLKRPIIVGLFHARADAELIGIAERERDPELRRQIIDHLRLLGTPRAKAYLQKVGQHR